MDFGIIVAYSAALFTLLIANASNVVGFVMPLLVRGINKDIPKERDRHILSVAACVVAGLLLHWHDLAIGNPGAFAAATAIIFIESNTMYKLWFRPRWRSGTIEEEMKVSSPAETSQ